MPSIRLAARAGNLGPFAPKVLPPKVALALVIAIPCIVALIIVMGAAHCIRK